MVASGGNGGSRSRERKRKGNGEQVGERKQVGVQGVVGVLLTTKERAACVRRGMAAWAREHRASASRHCGDRKGTTFLQKNPVSIFFI